MNFDQNNRQSLNANPAKKGRNLLLKLIGGFILIFLLLFIMNYVVKSEVSALIEKNAIIVDEKPLPINSN